MEVNGGILRHLGAASLALSFLLIARDEDATTLVGDDAVLQRRVVASAAQAKDTLKFPLKFPLLFRGGLECVREVLRTVCSFMLTYSA
jgi:hypothetical protein